MGKAIEVILILVLAVYMLYALLPHHIEYTIDGVKHSIDWSIKDKNWN